MLAQNHQKMRLKPSKFAESLIDYYSGNTTPAESLRQHASGIAHVLETLHHYGARYGLLPALQQMALQYVRTTRDDDDTREEMIKAAYNIASAIETINAHADEICIIADYLNEAIQTDNQRGAERPREAPRANNNTTQWKRH